MAWGRKIYLSTGPLILSRLLALFLAASFTRAHAAFPPHPWQQWGRSATHSASSPYTGPSHFPTTLWSVPSDTSFFASPVVSFSGVVYTASHGACVSAWDAQTGATLWNACPLYASGFFASPALSAEGDIVFAVTRPGAFYALRTLNGSVAWQRNLVSGADPVVVDGSIAVSPTTGFLFVGTVVGAVFALNASDGTDVWPPFETGANISSTPALWGGNIFFSSSNGFLYCVDEALGRLRWSAMFSSPGIGDFVRSALMSSPTISLDGKHLFIGTADGTVVSMCTDTGAIAWRRNVTAFLGSPSAPSIDCTPSLSPDGTLVYVGTSFLNSHYEGTYGSVLALAAATGDVVWAAPIATDVVSSPTGR